MPCEASECSMPTWMAPKLPPPANTNAVFGRAVSGCTPFAINHPSIPRAHIDSMAAAARPPTHIRLTSPTPRRHDPMQVGHLHAAGAAIPQLRSGADPARALRDPLVRARLYRRHPGRLEERPGAGQPAAAVGRAGAGDSGGLR